MGPRAAAVAAAPARRHGHRLHETAGKGPQPETLFRPNAAALAGGGGEGEVEEGKPGEQLPGFMPDIGPAHEYGEGERPQPQTAREPDNPLPAELLPNHLDEARERAGCWGCWGHEGRRRGSPQAWPRAFPSKPAACVPTLALLHTPCPPLRRRPRGPSPRWCLPTARTPAPRGRQT